MIHQKFIWFFPEIIVHGEKFTLMKTLDCYLICFSASRKNLGAINNDQLWKQMQHGNKQ
jgi:hypothetical protein